MPRLVDVLECLRQPGREHIWVLLDIKVNHAVTSTAEEPLIPILAPADINVVI